MTSLFVIDQTSRMYGYKVPEEGLNVRIDGQLYNVTKEEHHAEAFEAALAQKSTVTILDKEKGTAMFSCSRLIGVQVHIE